MKYFEFEFHLRKENDNVCSLETASDILTGLLADLGFEAFESTTDGIKGYIQTQLYNQDCVNDITNEFPLPGWSIMINHKEAEYANWNKQWEREGFQPIIIGNKLCVHDEAHKTIPNTGAPLPKTIFELIVSPKLAFGSGTHPTTRQLLEVLLETDVKDQHVIDAGCGTGILGMLCKMRGAMKVSSYDIDEWSVQNTEENSRLNNVSIKVWLGDASVLPKITNEEGQANLLIANINRNILLNDMPEFVKAINLDKGKLLLSGFYEADIPYLIDKANSLGLIETFRIINDGWAVLMLQHL